MKTYSNVDSYKRALRKAIKSWDPETSQEFLSTLKKQIKIDISSSQH